MIENRKSFRIPFRTKFVFANESNVFTANSVNISSGGIFVSCLETLPRETMCKALFLLTPESDPINIDVVVKRVSQSTTDPEHVPGLGFQFVATDNLALQKQIDEYMEETRKNYEIASSILSSGEPDMNSLNDFIKRMHLPMFQDFGELRFYVERILRAIELVESSHR